MWRQRGALWVSSFLTSRVPSTPYSPSYWDTSCSEQEWPTTSPHGLKTTSPTGHTMWGHRTVSPSGHCRELFWLQSCSHTYTSDSAPQPATCRSSMRNPQLPASSLTEMIGSTGEEIQNFVDWCLRTAYRVTLEKSRSCQWTSAGDNLLHLHLWASRVRTLSGWPPTSTWILILRINLSGPTTWTLYIGRVTPTLPKQETEVCWCAGNTLQDLLWLCGDHLLWGSLSTISAQNRCSVFFH